MTPQPQTPLHQPNWIEDFAPFTALHWVSVAFFVGLIAGACWLGHCWRETPKEARFRRLWGWVILAYSAWYTAFYFLPSHFDWKKSLPLQLCDLAAIAAGIAMVGHWRWSRTLLYFWGIGLSTQAFISPIIQMGIGSIWFWLFWIGHTMIVGSAIYDVVVCGYRPGGKDLRFALIVSYIYTSTMFFLNVWLTLRLGEPINYAFVGQSKPENPTIMDTLGPWPERVAVLVAVVILDYITLWAIWPIARLMGWRWASEPAKS